MIRAARLAAPLLVACILIGPASFARGGAPAAARIFTFEVPFREAPVFPDILTRPIALLSLRAKVGDPDEPEQRVSLIVTAANGSGEDQEATIEFTLLDAAGASLASKIVEEEIEEGEMDDFSVKFRLPGQIVSRIARCRVSYEGGTP